jgi:hypothetical protein
MSPVTSQADEVSLSDVTSEDDDASVELEPWVVDAVVPSVVEAPDSVPDVDDSGCRHASPMHTKSPRHSPSTQGQSCVPG